MGDASGILNQCSEFKDALNDAKKPTNPKVKSEE